MTSTQSTDTEREGSMSFGLEFRDVCWDYELIAPAVESNTDHEAETDLVF